MESVCLPHTAVLSILPTRFLVDDRYWSVGSKRNDARFSLLVKTRAWKRVMWISNSMQKLLLPNLDFSFLHCLMAAERDRDRGRGLHQQQQQYRERERKGLISLVLVESNREEIYQSVSESFVQIVYEKRVRAPSLSQLSA